MQRFARIRGELRRTGNIIGDFDILIGATALQHKLTLVTRNLRDYTRIPHLDIYKAS
jgi:tRNA(fMet)-specific endonuclease VapC